MLRTVALLVCVMYALAADDGQYRPDNYNDGKYVHVAEAPRGFITAGARGSEGRYDGGDDGQYRPDNSGAYDGNNGVAGGFYKGGGGEYKATPTTENRYRGTQDQLINRANPFLANALANKPKAAPITTTQASRANIAPITTTQNSRAKIAPAPQPKNTNNPFYDRQFAILRQLDEPQQDGYRYLYETENQILAEETGRYVPSGEKDESVASVKGFYQYVGDDGVLYRVDYIADENGYQPSGAHLPV